MNNNDEKLRNALKNAHEEIQPSDSWEDLKTRINEKILEADSSSQVVTKLNNNIHFWRKTAIAAAACFAVTAILLVYFIYNNKAESRNNNIAYLLSQSNLQQLNEAFSNIQELFENKCSWIVIGSEGNSEIGINNNINISANEDEVVIMRLAFNFEGTDTKSEFIDIVALAEQLVSFKMPVDEHSDMNITLKPIVNDSGTITIEINTQIDSGSKIANALNIANDSFKSLARIKSNGYWVNINATGRSFSNI